MSRTKQKQKPDKVLRSISIDRWRPDRANKFTIRYLFGKYGSIGLDDVTAYRSKGALSLDNARIVATMRARSLGMVLTWISETQAVAFRDRSKR